MGSLAIHGRGAAFLGAIALLSACTGVLGDNGADADDAGVVGPGDGRDPTNEDDNVDDDEPACGFTTTPLSRLTRREYDRTVVDLLRLDPQTERPSEGMPEDDRVEGFPVGLAVTPLHVEKIQGRAEALAESALVHPERLLPCELPPIDAAAEEACATEFIDEFGVRAYRRPLSEGERTALRRLYDVGREGGARPFLEGIQLVVEGALVAPQLWYHGLGDPGGEPGDAVELRGFELANRLAYFLWGTMPDDALFEEAAAGRLETAEDARREARRMLDDPRAKDALYAFFDALIGLDRLQTANRDQTLYPSYDGQTSRDLAAGLVAFLDDAVLEQGTFDALFASRRGFATAGTATIFGLSEAQAETLGDEPSAVDLPEGERLGLLTQPGVLVVNAKPDQSDPIHRGVFIRRKILCQDLPAPPADIDTNVPPPTPDQTTRERFAAHTADPACAGCHSLIDPLGFPLEAFDATGAFRTTEGDLPIDTTGEVIATSDADGPVADAVELAAALASSDDVRACFVSHYFHVATKRVEVDGDECHLDALVEDFLVTGDFRELMVEVAANAAFRTRVVAVGAERVEGEVE
jgi:hypothetical protein